MPPGAIGSQQLQRGGPLPGYFQPVEIHGPEGPDLAGRRRRASAKPDPAPLQGGMLIGPVYRLAGDEHPACRGVEVFPTVEVIDRLYPPIGQEVRSFPIPIELTQEDLEMAAAGKFVTRVIYLEDPDSGAARRLANHDEQA